MGDRDFGELSLKDIVASLRDWKGGIDGWPEAWQRKGLGEHWQWQEVWRNWKKMKGIIPSRIWVVWWRVLRRNVMLRNRIGGGQRKEEVVRYVEKLRKMELCNLLSICFKIVQ